MRLQFAYITIRGHHREARGSALAQLGIPEDCVWAENKSTHICVLLSARPHLHSSNSFLPVPVISHLHCTPSFSSLLRGLKIVT